MSIPVNQLASVSPGVIGAGGASQSLIGLILTRSTRVPIGTVLPLGSLAAVQAYFGSGSTEAAMAATYFQGPDNAAVTPGSLLFYQYTGAAPVGAWVRGGNVGALGLTYLQGLLTTGVITLTIDGTAKTSSAINLSSATSFSNAASIIQTALGASDAVVTAAIAVTTGIMTVSAVSSGTLAAGQVLTGTGVPGGTTITSQLSGTTGGVGTYQTSIVTAVASTTVTAGAVTVTYDSTSGGFQINCGSVGATSTITYATGTLAAGLLLTAASGAIISQGQAAATPAAAMAAVIAVNANWGSFATTWEAASADAIAFAGWTSGQSGMFGYVQWSTDVTLTNTVPATASAIYAIIQAADAGTFPIYAPVNQQLAAALALSIAPSTNWGAPNARQNFAFVTQSGLAPDVVNGQIALNLIANGVNFYGQYAVGSNSNNLLYPGSITGPRLWADSFFDAAWMNSSFQQAMMALLIAVKSIPYTPAGYALVREAMSGPIAAALSFGAIRAGVTLSSTEIAAVNAMAGFDIATTIANTGWYLLISNPSAQVRAARGSPPMTFFYTDGQSIQQLTLASLEVI
ncbi:MAG TPA: DUF3383 family protein [Caulobacteraceae bacterium]|jgi:hypothetical protein|nr:DUF3383 family protein [Caulobacteraceae bacterium]